MLSRLEQIKLPPGQDAQIGGDTVTALKHRLAAIVAECGKTNLKLTQLSVARFWSQLKPGQPFSAAQMQASVREIKLRFHDELSVSKFYYVTAADSELYEQPTKGWEASLAVFPSVQPEVEESSKCLGLGRATASVFHQMRVMESGLKAVAWKLGIPYSPNWESYIKQINDRIVVKHRKKGIQWKRDERFFAEVASHLGSVRVAWRNPTMHIERSYTLEEATEVFQATRGFMAHLSKRLTEKPPRKRR